VCHVLIVLAVIFQGYEDSLDEELDLGGKVESPVAMETDETQSFFKWG